MYQAQRYFRALELDKVLSKLSDQANCDDSKRLALQLTPSDDYFTVRSLMQKTSDAYMLSARYTSPAFHKLKNCSDALRKAQKGSDLSLRELMDASSLLHNIRSVKDWRKRCEGEKTSLDPLFEVLVPNKDLENLIDGAVVSEEELADSASSELANLRRKINAAKLRVRERLDQLIKSPTQSKYLQDALVTMRDGRFVVPVKSEYRSEIKGLVHDTSASGATVFVEPMGVVEANNEIRVLQAQEKREIERIIHELSQRVGDFAESMVESYKALVEIDLYFAKAALAYKMKATVPKLVDNGQIDLKKARHPLIDPQKVVPIDVNLGIDFNTLVITGPNTGGKTVTLKTVGLLTLMAMCGLMLPVAEGSVISVYKKVLVDIGDEQSIEQSLSTFSAHMTNIVSIIGEADSDSLVLIDELGDFHICLHGHDVQENSIAAFKSEHEIINGFFFGPALVVDGEVQEIPENYQFDPHQKNPRAGIAQLGTLTYALVAVNGRTDQSAGVTLAEFADIMGQLGAKQAYNLDGGNSATLAFNGEVYNDKPQAERAVTDIIYFASATAGE